MMPRSDSLETGYNNPSASSFVGRSRSQQGASFHSGSGMGGPSDGELRQRFGMQQVNSQSSGNSGSAPLTPGGGAMMMETQAMMGGGHHQSMGQPSSSMGGYRHDAFSSSPGVGNVGGGGFNMTDLSPSVSQRMHMGSGTSMYPHGSGGSGGSHSGGGHSHAHQLSAAAASSPLYTPRNSLGMADVMGDGRPPLSGGSQGSVSGMSQAEREEELLLNLLIARRQRSRMSGESPGSGIAAAGAASGRSAQTLADELIRLRQGRTSFGGSSGSGSGHSSQQQGQTPTPHHHRHASPQGVSGGPHQLPPIPGMPPLYTDGPSGSGPSGTSHHHHHSHMNAGIHAQNYDNYVLKSEAVMGLPNAVMTDVSERIDRSPMGVVDARAQELRDFSGRGIKRSAALSGMGLHGHGPMGVPFDAHGGQFKFQNQIELQGLDAGPVNKKKRTHKKKPADMPRRPLSAYNLFFSEERERILKEIENKEGGGKPEDGIKKEDEKSVNSASSEGKGDKKNDGLTEDGKPKALLRPMIPAQKKRRPHRKTHGKISFQQLARMVGERWKSLPDDKRKYYQGLAQEDLKRQKVAMEEYYAKQNAAKSSPPVTSQNPNQDADGDTEMGASKESMQKNRLKQEQTV